MLKYLILVSLFLFTLQVLPLKALVIQTPQEMPVTFMTLDNEQAQQTENPFAGANIKYMLPIPKEGIESLLPEGLGVTAKAFVPGGVDLPYEMWDLSNDLGTYQSVKDPETGALLIDKETGTITPVDSDELMAEVGFRLDLTKFPQLYQSKYVAFYVYPNSAPVNLDLEFTFNHLRESQQVSVSVPNELFSKLVLMGKLPNPFTKEQSARLVVINLDKLRKFARDELRFVTIFFNNGPKLAYFRNNIPAVLTNLSFIGSAAK